MEARVLSKKEEPDGISNGGTFGDHHPEENWTTAKSGTSTKKYPMPCFPALQDNDLKGGITSLIISSWLV